MVLSLAWERKCSANAISHSNLLISCFTMTNDHDIGSLACDKTISLGIHAFRKKILSPTWLLIAASRFSPHKTQNYLRQFMILLMDGNNIVFHQFFFLLALQLPMGVVFYSRLVGFSLLAYEVS